MPDRVPDPSLENIFNDWVRRLQAVERQTITLPEGTDPLQTFENGSPMGDTRFLDFGANIDAVLVGDDYVTISAAATAPEFDAICDSSLTVSQPADRLFKGIGEALTYLRGTVGLTQRAIVLVRQHPTSTSITVNRYQETAAVTAIPNNVFLFSSTRGSSRSTPTRPIWDHNGYDVSVSNIYCEGLVIKGYGTGSGGGAGKTALFTGSGDCVLRDSVVDAGNMSLTSGRSLIQSSGNAFLYGCSMQNGWLAFTEAYDCELRYYTSGTYNPAIGTRFIMDGCILWADTLGSAAVTWNLPATTIIRLVPRDTGSASVIPLWSCGAAGGYYNIDLQSNTDTLDLTSTGTPQQIILKGSVYNKITLVAPASGSFHDVQAMAGGTIDITGPAIIDTASAALLKIRGRGVNGHHVTSRAGGSGGTAVDFIAAINCHIDAATGAAPGGGTTKSYAFDAASTGNLLVWQNHGAYPVAGTDAGTNNRVLPEGAVPFTTNGHVIQDEGVSLTQRLNLDFAGAGVTATDTAGRTLVTIPATATTNGHVIEDEGTPLTQRANMNFVGAGVTATDAGGKTVVTIPAGAVENNLVAWVGL